MIRSRRYFWLTFLCLICAAADSGTGFSGLSIVWPFFILSWFLFVAEDDLFDPIEAELREILNGGLR